MAFFSDLRRRFRRFGTGRRGPYALSADLFRAALALTAASLFFPRRRWYHAGLALFLLGLFRMFSRNIAARARENELYLRKRGAALRHWEAFRQRCRDRKFYRYFRCPSCGRKLRVPRPPERGPRRPIEITCPVCRHRFIRKR